MKRPEPHPLMDPMGGPIPIYTDEKLEDLQRAGLRLIQKRKGFRFGEDAVLLAHYAADHWQTNRRVIPRYIELGSHSGVVSILLSALLPGATGLGIELIARQVEVMERNILLNDLEDRLSILQADIHELAEDRLHNQGELTPGMADLVVCNPPYGVPGRGISRGGEDPLSYEVRVAREEIACTFAEICTVAKLLLRPYGRFIFCHRPDRLPEIMTELVHQHLMPTEMRLVFPHEGDEPTLILMSAISEGRPGGFSIQPPLYMRRADGSYTAMAEAFIGSPDIFREEEGHRRVCYVSQPSP